MGIAERLETEHGERLRSAIPQGHWRTTTLVAGLRVSGSDAPTVIDGPIDAERLLAHVQHVPVPTLIPGDTVIMANSGRHKGAAVREAIVAAGVRLLCLPPCSPDFNPVENAFPKLRTPLRKVAARTRDAVRGALGTALDAVTRNEC